VGVSVFELRFLGPVQAVRAGRDVPLGGPRQRAVLALLALDAGRVIPAGRLVDEVWLGRPPLGAAKTLRSYVSRLGRRWRLRWRWLRAGVGMRSALILASWMWAGLSG
jgi:DNA-binding response OmpR family regulator